jgi:hypothetical protein
MSGGRTRSAPPSDDGSCAGAARSTASSGVSSTPELCRSPQARVGSTTRQAPGHTLGRSAAARHERRRRRTPRRERTLDGRGICVSSILANAVQRLADPALLARAGNYVDDLPEPGLTHVVGHADVGMGIKAFRDQALTQAFRAGSTGARRPSVPPTASNGDRERWRATSTARSSTGSTRRPTARPADDRVFDLPAKELVIPRRRSRRMAVRYGRGERLE